MSKTDPSTATAALAAGAVALVVILAIAWFSPVRLGAAGTKVASAGEPAVVQSIEGGVQTGGYIDGRPVPSGFTMPVVIRYKAPDAEAKDDVAQPAETGAIPRP
jgi:hypothetical protein